MPHANSIKKNKVRSTAFPILNNFMNLQQYKHGIKHIDIPEKLQDLSSYSKHQTKEEQIRTLEYKAPRVKQSGTCLEVIGLYDDIFRYSIKNSQ